MYFCPLNGYSSTARSLRNPVPPAVVNDASCMRFAPTVFVVVVLTADQAGVCSDALVSGINETSPRVVTSGYWIAIAPAESLIETWAGLCSNGCVPMAYSKRLGMPSWSGSSVSTRSAAVCPGVWCSVIHCDFVTG